eukprot:3842919-Amphidinium_carterae.1
MHDIQSLRSTLAHMESTCRRVRWSSPLLALWWEIGFGPQSSEFGSCLVHLLDSSQGSWSAKLYALLEALRYTLLPRAQEVTYVESEETHGSGEGEQPDLLSMLKMAVPSSPASHFVVNVGAGEYRDNPAAILQEHNRT